MGKVIMSGIVPQLVVPRKPGIQASELAVGSTVKLMENGAPVEYLVVNQGIPGGSSLYDSSCDGTWLLRKNIHSKVQYGPEKYYADYSQTGLHLYLNNTFLALFDGDTQAAIKQVKIPYPYNSGYLIGSGENGLLTKIFPLSAKELNAQETSYAVDGAVLSYFNDATQTNDPKRIAYLNGIATNYWIRSTIIEDSYCQVVLSYGGFNGVIGTSNEGNRPALILPSTALFDEETLILKGVA